MSSELKDDKPLTGSLSVEDCRELSSRLEEPLPELRAHVSGWQREMVDTSPAVCAPVHRPRSVRVVESSIPRDKEGSRKGRGRGRLARICLLALSRPSLRRLQTNRTAA